MKVVVAILLTILTIQTSLSQNLEQCREIVKITTEAINTKSTVELENNLASDFEIANQKGQMAKIVLKQLFTQLGETVESYKEINTQTLENTLILTYSIYYSKMGEKNAIFVFDEQNKLKKLELFKMEVKTMDDSERKISKPKNDVITIPFFMIGNLMAVEVMLNNEKKIFLFDSGSPKVILNSKYIKKNDTIKTKSISSAKGVNGSISGLNIELVEKIEFAGITMGNQKILTLDISHIEKSLETEIFGLIGYEIVKDYDLLFDYQKKVLILINPDYFAQYKQKKLLNSKLTIIPFELSSHIPVIKTIIGKKTYSFGIDCGAEVNLMDAKLLKPVTKYLKHIEKDTLSGADKNSKEVAKGLIKKMKIGKLQFKNLNTVFNDMSHLNNGYKLQLDGLIGFEILSKQRTIISYNRKEMIIIE
ncbi:MAG: aspartyl protease family protein [Flavobacteriaceae bacterium]|nr:aspartyl protease family protein [Flavobacteriaceae bacterium]